MNHDHALKINKVGSLETQSDDFPVYTIRDGFLYRTVAHPMGWSENPDYRLGDDGKLYRTKYHLQGISLFPEYEFGSNGKLYRTETHVEGASAEPEFEIMD